MDKSIERIQAAVVDGRSRTPRYIQRQLTVLHDALVQSATPIQKAIVRDTSCSAAEAWFEVHATLKAVKQHFDSVNFRDFLQQEYSLAQGKDNASRRTPYGCAYIIPAQHTRFYSIIQPIAAAIAAGNCVVVEMSQTLLEVESLLRKVLSSTMDKDTFAIVEQRPASDKFFTEQVVVANCISDETQYSTSKVFNSPARRTIAVVDRTANISDAAKHIVRARFRFSGKSQYAPDVVLVNEFALKDFCQAAARHLTDEISESVTANGHSKPQPGTTNSLQKDLQQAGTTTLVSGARGSIHLLKQRSSSIQTRKINDPVLLVAAVTSLDDAIDTANSSGSLLATYFFADPAATKYLSQFITSDVSYANFIPPQLLVGPPAPKGFPISLDARYTKDMFSAPSPEYITQTIEDKTLTAFLDNTPSKQAVEKLKTEIQSPLAPMGEPMTTTVGFFEQGLFTGMAIEATLLVGVLGVCARYAIPVVLKKVRG